MAARDSPPKKSNFSIRNLLYDTTICTLVSLILLILSLSSAALIFSGPLGEHLLYGIGLVFASIAITAIFLSLFSSFPQVVASPQDTSVIILAVSCTAIAHKLEHMGAHQQIFPTVITTIILSSVFIGLLMFLMGKFELGNYARFIPHHVLGGFFAGTGLLIIGHSWVVFTGEEFQFQDIHHYVSLNMLELWIPATVLGIVLFAVWRMYWQPLMLPPIVILSALLFYCVLYFGDISFDEALERGFCLGPFAKGEAMWNLPKFSFIQQTNWEALASQLGNLLSMAVLTPLSLLLNATVVEAETKDDMKLNTEMKYAGFANFIAPALGGGVFADHGLIGSVLNHKLGTKTRIAGFVIAAVFFVALMYSNTVVELLPRFVIGGVVLYVGIDLIAVWLWDARQSYSLAEYCVIVIIAAVIVVEGFLEGLLLGLIVSFAVFVVNYSKMRVIKQYLLGSYMHSNVERGAEARKVLESRGGEIHVIYLQGFIFFGNAHKFFDEVNSCYLSDQGSSVKYIILDFKSVKGLDSSSIYSFEKLYNFAKKNDILIVYSDLNDQLYQILSKHIPIQSTGDEKNQFPNLDYALEWCEEKLLHEEVTLVGESMSCKEKLKVLVGSEEYVSAVSKYFESLSVQEGFVLFEQGAEATDLYFLESGFVEVHLIAEGGKKIRLRTIGPGTVIGELGLFLNIPRSAAIVTTEKCKLYRLTKDRLEALNKEEPAAALQLQELIITQLASRLVYSNNQIHGLLQPSCCEE